MDKDIEKLVEKLRSKEYFEYDIVMTKDEEVMLADDSGLSDLSTFIKYSGGVIVLDLENMKAYHIPRKSR